MARSPFRNPSLVQLRPHRDVSRSRSEQLGGGWRPGVPSAGAPDPPWDINQPGRRYRHLRPGVRHRRPSGRDHRPDPGHYADSSQHSAIIDAVKGRDFVIEGPPGTGKSQTIANLIATFINQNKTVLFVSEKMAALEVVKSRLDRVGLGDFCLTLHSAGARPATVIETLKRRAGMHAPRPRPAGAEATHVALAKSEMSAHLDALHARLGPNGETVHVLIGQYTGIEARRPYLPRCFVKLLQRFLNL